MTHPSLPLVLVTMFALLGFSGLLYASLWTYYLKLFLGHAAYAQTLVLAIFMGGLAVGRDCAATGRRGGTISCVAMPSRSQNPTPTPISDP